MPRRILAALVVLAAARTAHADCGVPTWVGTPAGTELPLRGSLYVFNERGLEPRLDWRGTAGKATAVAISETVFRVDYAGSAGSKLTVVNLYDEGSTYPLVDHWQPAAKAPRVMQYWHDAYTWTCSYSDELMVQLDQPTAAIRARWTSGPQVTEWLLPARTDDKVSVLELGKINCGGTTLSPDALRLGGKLELTAIGLDGSEHEVSGLPARLATDEMPTDDRGLAHAFQQIGTLPAPAATPAAPQLTSPHRGKPGPALGLAVLAVLGLGAAIAWRLRVRAPEPTDPTDVP